MSNETSFAPAVYEERLKAAARLAAERNLSGLVLGTGPELAYLCGSWISSHERLSALVVPAHPGARPSFIIPWVERSELIFSPVGSLDIQVRGWADGDNPHQLVLDALGNVGADDTIAIGGSLPAIHLIPLQQLTKATTKLATSVMRDLFMRKDETELSQLTAAAAAIDRVIAQVPGWLKPGITERDVAIEIERAILAVGHHCVDFIIVGSGPNGANPHHTFSDRVLQPGDPVVIDIGGTWGVGYRSDTTRTFIVPGADPDPEFLRRYEVLMQAQEAAVNAVKPGVTAEYIDKVARSQIAAAGFGSEFIHRTGHGIGLSTHEEPFIMEGNKLVLEPGMAFSVEPGIYRSGLYGARIEDIVYVTETGFARLNSQPRTLR